MQASRSTARRSTAGQSLERSYSSTVSTAPLMTPSPMPSNGLVSLVCPTIPAAGLGWR